MAAPKKGRRSPGAQGRPGRALVGILVAMVALVGGMFLSGNTTPRLGIDLAGGTSFTLEAKNEPGKPNAINKANMDTAVNIMERRVNGLGVSEAEVQTQGRKHIIVNIPKGTDAKQARKQVGTTAKLGFRPVLSIGDGKPTKDPGADKPKPKPTPTKGADKGDNKDQPKGDEPTSPTPTASSTTQGRALPSALKAPTPKPSPTGDAPTKPSKEQADQVKKAEELQKQFAALDCTTPKARAAASQQAATRPNTEPIVACDRKGEAKFILAPVQLEGKHVEDASAVYSTQGGSGWIVQLDFDGKGGKQFGKITGELAKQQPPQNQFGIVLDGEVASNAEVSFAIKGGKAEISGSFEQQEADDLANILSYGSLPLTFDIVDETTVSSALGEEQLNAGLIAGGIGLVLVILYMGIYYRGLALVAIASLGVSAILTYSLMVLLGEAIQFALNLPAVCGAIVAIGITADSFIVYFERVRDEIREGRTLRPAVQRGWPRARRTILVSDFVSFLAAAVLFIVTVGKVQGFAFTLGLTTLLDVVVVFFFTKPLMTILATRPFFASGHPWSGLDPKRLGAKPPLRSRRRPIAPADTKEA
ncbi:protein translocase subunit SecD [Streptomyces zagrosensis]|uniref:Protein translocase subunit SecD n=1 Tax=Streptomyces zagrosensis TaxID=1042984 RepID=A0A7W9Q8L8_9ACTN|nr:protein translocase subunit SecD [Streptomyces zagrosensis]MBB5935621.1 preprotein translocase subunit SecD [Streptomyces zagrosensis]